MTESNDPLLEAAIILWNDGRWLAAHEVLEELWERSEGASADFYKGLIQAAVALHHLEEENLEGAARLHRGHRRLLAPFLPVHEGIDVAAFLASMESVIRPALAAEPGAPPPEPARPRIERA